MDNEKLTEFKNAVSNLSSASRDEDWDKVRKLFDKLYNKRHEPLEADRFWPESWNPFSHKDTKDLPA